MTPLTSFLSRLNPLVPGCPEPVALQALRDTAIDFCERTHLVQHVTDPMPVIPEQPEYDVDLPSDTTVARILAVWYGDSRLELAPAQTVTAVGAYVIGGRSRPTAAYVTVPNTVRLYPVPGPEADESLVIKVATKPTRKAASVSAMLLDDWAEVIVHGALARLAVQPGTSYSNAELAIFGMNSYGAGVSRAKLEARKGRVMGEVRVLGDTFSGVRR